MNAKRIVMAIAALLVILAWFNYDPGSDARKKAKEKTDDRRENPVH